VANSTHAILRFTLCRGGHRAMFPPKAATMGCGPSTGPKGRKKNKRGIGSGPLGQG